MSLPFYILFIYYIVLLHNKNYCDNLFYFLYNEINGKEIMKIETERLLIIELNMDMAEAVHKNSLDEDNRRFVPD